MTRQQKLERLRKVGEETVILRQSLIEKFGHQILECADVIAGVIGSRGKILICGNGGHAAMSSHFAAELVVRLSADRNRQALPALALSVDPAILTAASNDYGYKEVFARQVEALGQKGDMLIVMSTSGNSPNCLRAVQTARAQGLLTFGLLGADGGKLVTMVERSIVIPHPSAQRIQEEHLFLVHHLVELIESDLFA